MWQIFHGERGGGREDSIMWHWPVGSTTVVTEDWTIPSAACHYWRLNDPFTAYTTAETPKAFYGPENPKIAPSCADFDPILYTVSWAHKSQSTKWHLDRFSCTFAQHVHVTNTQTDRNTDHATWSVFLSVFGCVAQW